MPLTHIATRTTLGLTAMLLLTMAAAPAMAAPGDEFFIDDGDGSHRGVPTPVFMNFTGTGKTRTNATYDITIDAQGRGMERMSQASDLASSPLRARVVAHIKAVTQGGVKEGRIVLAVFLRQDNGAWTWNAISRARADNGLPRLGLRGTATQTSPGHFALVGEGRAQRSEEGGFNVKLAVTGNLQERQPSPYSLTLSGTGLAKDNSTYALQLAGTGDLMSHLRNGTLARVDGWVKAHATVTAPNGTVVKDRTFWIHVQAFHLDSAGKFVLYSAAERVNDLPRLMLHGTAAPNATGGYDLSGKGSLVIWTYGDRLPLRLSLAGSIAAA